MLQDAGFKVTTTPLPQSDVDPLFRSGQKDGYQASISASGDPASIVNNELLGGFKLYNDTDGSLKTLADQAVNPKLSQAERAKLYDQIWTKAAEQYVEINICNTRQYAVYNKNLQGVDADAADLGGTPDPRADSRRSTDDVGARRQRGVACCVWSCGES